MDTIDIGGTLVGKGHPPYIIAEIGANHNGDMELCKKLIRAAQASGANAAKFQSWTQDSLISNDEYVRNSENGLKEAIAKYELSEKQHYLIKGYCDEIGIEFLSTGFCLQEVDMLETLGVKAHKIASMDINHHVLLEKVAKTGKPIILSTGMATLSEISEAIDVIYNNGNKKVILLHCVSLYPPSYDAINLNNIIKFKNTFSSPVGYSDHSLGSSVALAAIALGACLIEKHFTLDKKMEGWDHAVSADPEDMDIIVKEGRNIYNSLGHYDRVLSAEELNQKKNFRRRVVVKSGTRAGKQLSLEDFEFKRPGTGIHPNEVKYLIGRKLKQDVQSEKELRWDDFE